MRSKLFEPLLLFKILFLEETGTTRQQPERLKNSQNDRTAGTTEQLEQTDIWNYLKDGRTGNARTTEMIAAPIY